MHVDEESYFEKISESVHREDRLGKIAERIAPDKFVVLTCPDLKKKKEIDLAWEQISYS